MNTQKMLYCIGGDVMADVPKYILDSIDKAEKHYRIALKHSRIIRDFLEKHGVSADSEDQGLMDSLIDNIELAQGDASLFIDDLSQFLKKSNVT